jgi:DNA-binding PadR family transcriptional regulator
LKPDGDIGRVWSLSRPLTYRALDQLVERGYVEPVGEEPGIAGGNRTILAATRSGRAALRRWISTPVPHLRDLRSELLLKLVIAELCQLDTSVLLAAQRVHVERVATVLKVPRGRPGDPVDVVALWRSESAQAALRVLERLTTTP